MHTYAVKEIFGPTIQGEGAYAGAACVFLRFAACNLACSWCDTDFSPANVQKLTAEQITNRLCELDVNRSRRVIVTGGEPTLQWDAALSTALAGAGFTVHMESNGTTAPVAPVDWLTVSPKPQFHDRHELAGQQASECKVVVDDTVTGETLRGYERQYRCELRFPQPCMVERYDLRLARARELLAHNPGWRLSVQPHMFAGAL